MTRDSGSPFSLAIGMRYASKMRPPPMLIPPDSPLAERLLDRAMAHEMRATRLRDLAKLLVEPTETGRGGRQPMSTLTVRPSHRTRST